MIPLVRYSGEWRAASPSGVALSALLLASTAFGIFTAIAYAIVPPRLAALERRSALPEDFAGARRGLVDRLFRERGWLRGRVVDFIDFQWFPIFNVADMAVTIGGVLLLLAAVMESKVPRR